MTNANVRAYVPVLLDDLDAVDRAGAPHAAYVPDRMHRGLAGEALEEAEWYAQAVAAETVLDAAVAARRPRVVIACDVPAARLAGARPLVEGVETIPDVVVDPSTVVAYHVDDPEVLADLPTESAAAAEALREAGLLWFDASERAVLPEVFRA
ncbi:DUF6912 family protein [Brevibacterium litoralis]|uniref:DUF6912 family protein n=1 Tax=Brevibacterium litoralis TaxID=3138935 RepID=UPI0032EAD539